MRTQTEILSLAETRLAEARSLFKSGYLNGAYYLGGYAVELALKGMICKTLDADTLFDESNPLGVRPETRKAFKVHDLDVLMLLSGLKKKFENERSSSLSLHTAWSIVNKWNESCRYLTESKTAGEVESFLNATYNPSTDEGLLPWIKKHL